MTPRLLKLYPRAWRERYGDEFAELLAQERFRLGLVVDVVAGALDAHVQGFIRSRHMKRTAWLAFSFGIHSFIVAAAVYATSRQVDELAPPQLMIWFKTIPTPTPVDDTRADTAKPVKQVRSAGGGHGRALTQPPERLVEGPLKIEDQQTEVPIGTGGTGGDGGTGGTGGGTGNDTQPPAGPPKLIDETVGESYKMSGRLPSYLPVARMAGVQGTVAVKVCVDTSGGVTGVQILSSVPLLDDEVVRTVSTWRYRPFRYNNRPLPFCHPAYFEFKLK